VNIFIIKMEYKMSNIDNKISFISGFALTSTWTLPLYNIGMALLLGIVGGFGGLVGRWVYKKIWPNV